MRKSQTLAVLVLALLAWAVYASAFTVDVTEYGVVTRFGRVLRVIEQPGLQFKSPFDRVVRLDKRLLHFQPAEAEYLSADKKNLVIDSLVTWRIIDPQRFLQAIGSRAQAETQLGDSVLAGIGSILGDYPFASLVSTHKEQSQFQAMVARIREHVDSVARPAYGIEVIDVKVRQLSLPEQNKRYVFERMRAERGKIAMEYRSEGEREAQKIIAAADREKTRTLAQAYQQAARTRGEADAEVMRIYADRFGAHPEFYQFVRTLQTYEKVLDGNTTLFLPADADAFQALPDGQAPLPE
jgi:membrane protease subunit HflC